MPLIPTPAFTSRVASQQVPEGPEADSHRRERSERRCT